MAGAANILALLSQTIYDSWLDWQWESRLCAAFDSSPASAIPDFVERPAEVGKVGRAITGTSTRYDVIVGTHGTGKSTIVQKIAWETSRALYVLVQPGEDVRSAIARRLLKHLVVRAQSRSCKEPEIDCWPVSAMNLL